MILIRAAFVIGLAFAIIGCDSPTSVADRETSTSTPDQQPQTSSEVRLQFQVGGTSNTDKSSSLSTVEAQTQYTLDGNYATSGAGYMSVTPPNTASPGATKWNTGTEAPESIVSSSVDYSDTNVEYYASGSNASESLHPDFQTAMDDATLDLQTADQDASNENLSGPGDQQLEPVAKSTGSREKNAVKKNAPAPGKAFQYFKEQGYDVEPLGKGKFQLRRELSPNSGLSVVIEHVYDVRTKEIIRTRQIRDGQVISERTLDARKNGRSSFETTHYGPNGKPAGTSSMQINPSN